MDTSFQDNDKWKWEEVCEGEHSSQQPHLSPAHWLSRGKSGKWKYKNPSNITLLYLEKRNKGSELYEHTQTKIQ